MTDVSTSEILVAIISLASGIVVTYLGAVLKFRKDLEAEYDRDLRKERLKPYLELWNHLELLAEYSPEYPEITVQQLSTLSVKMREWYFRTGGIYLTEDGRKSYFYIQRAITELLKHPQKEKVSPETLKDIRNLSHILHSQLASDIGTRLKPRIKTTKTKQNLEQDKSLKKETEM